MQSIAEFMTLRTHRGSRNSPRIIGKVGGPTRLIFVVMVVLMPRGAFGQPKNDSSPTSVRITGRVMDTTNAGIPNTVVALKVSGIGPIIAQVRLDQDGRFTFPAVSPQKYELRFEAPGFDSLTLQAPQAAAGRDYDVGTVVLVVGQEKGYFVSQDSVLATRQMSSPESPIKVTLCELVKMADYYHGQFVELRAPVYPYGIDVTPRLRDSSCEATVWVYFPVEPALTNGKDLPTLKYYVEHYRRAEATISGKFKLVLRIKFDSPVFTLTLDSASDLAVTPPAVRTRKSQR